MSRTIYLAGNWKMNQDVGSIKNFFSELGDIFPTSNNNVKAWLAPQAIHLPLATLLAKSKNIAIGSQDCSDQKAGAYTGQLAPEALKDIGASFTLVGHSERREYNKESNELLNAKVHNALAANLEVVYCIGETLEERESEKTFDVLKEQLTVGLKDLKSSDSIIVAYEPVWAIGTGKTATPEMAEEAHAFIRKTLSEIGLDGNSISILYGGSVKPANLTELLTMPNIDGGLVGGASLKPADFTKLVEIASN